MNGDRRAIFIGRSSRQRKASLGAELQVAAVHSGSPRTMAIEVNRFYLFGSLTHKEDATTARRWNHRAVHLHSDFETDRWLLKQSIGANRDQENSADKCSALEKCAVNSGDVKILRTLMFVDKGSGYQRHRAVVDQSELCDQAEAH